MSSRRVETLIFKQKLKMRSQQRRSRRFYPTEEAGLNDRNSEILKLNIGLKIRIRKVVFVDRFLMSHNVRRLR